MGHLNHRPRANCGVKSINNREAVQVPEKKSKDDQQRTPTVRTRALMRRSATRTVRDAAHWQPER